MHPRLREIDDRLARDRDALLEAVRDVPPTLRSTRATDDGWSVAEVLDHLHRVEAGSAALLARRATRARENGVGADPETSSVLDRLDWANLVESTKRRIAPELVAPVGQADADACLTRLDESRLALRGVIQLLEHIDASQVKATHAALGEIDAYQWLLFIGQHERRHARQIADIGRALQGTA